LHRNSIAAFSFLDNEKHPSDILVTEDIFSHHEASPRIVPQELASSFSLDDGELDPFDNAVTEVLSSRHKISTSSFHGELGKSLSLDEQETDPFDSAVAEVLYFCDESSSSNFPRVTDDTRKENVVTGTSTVDFEPMPPLDYAVPDDSLFCLDTDFSSFMQRLETSTDLGDAAFGINDCGEMFTDISLEDEISNSKQVFTLSEYVDTCNMLQSIIKAL
jgi:hypothetical protein